MVEPLTGRAGAVSRILTITNRIFRAKQNPQTRVFLFFFGRVSQFRRISVTSSNFLDNMLQMFHEYAPVADPGAAKRQEARPLVKRCGFTIYPGTKADPERLS